ncbi:hypothetical protein [Paenibacillus sp. MMS18-CY102]|uniref:hypothetical protein n=1 Tax=Paenibacillus sp. MMS18-CY102 TaxID=2682849 RepID=UPI0013657594|nr:hypothetical protein [Paenibacillus sp. MMS18-CY102]MWC27505.1 hypothetical protein [Paenibacillus sp. MMS18-CY102]
MQKETTKKRSFTVPILLVLLTFCLIGNVLLYSLKLQNGQDGKRAQGEEIITAGLEAKQHVQLVAASLEQLAASADAADRTTVMFALGQAFQFASQLPAFIEAAESRTLPPHKPAIQAPEAFVADAERSLAAVGSHAGALTEKEKQYVAAMSEQYKQLSAILEPFGLDPKDKMVAMSTQSGGSWVEIGQKLQQIIDLSSAKL